ncbi:MAG: HD domain-containing protein [Methanomassiliicoccales archaeon]|nr:HD domain-containing protein [Methanomassiliicoccales archaeon]
MRVVAGKRQFVKNVALGDEVDDVFSVKYKKPPRKYANGFMFEVRVADRTGDITVKFWGPADEAAVRRIYDTFKDGDVIRVKGQASTYRDVLEISVNVESGGLVMPVQVSEYRYDDFVGSSKRDPDQMMSQLNSFVGKIENPHLQRLLQSFFSDEEFVEKFKRAPASISIHANWIGGLLEHTLNVVNLCDFLTNMYPKLDKDLLLAGAMLHDIGKVIEYTVTTNIDESTDGMLRGHIVAGAEMITRACDNIQDFPENLKLKMAHMILSHHGKPEHGSPKRPQFPEAAVVNLADDMDAQIEQYVRVKEEAQTDDQWTYSKRLGLIYLG